MSDFKKLTESVAFKNFEKCNKITAKLECIRKMQIFLKNEEKKLHDKLLGLNGT